MQTTSKHKEHVIIHSDNWVQMQWEKNSRERRAIVSHLSHWLLYLRVKSFQAAEL